MGPSSHSTLLPSPLSFQTAAKMKIADKAKKRHKDTVSHLCRLAQPSHASRFSFSLKQCGFHAAYGFCFHVQDAIADFGRALISSRFIFTLQTLRVPYLKLGMLINLQVANKKN